MPVFAVFALAIYSSSRFGVASGPAIGLALLGWTLFALTDGVSILAIGCVIAATNMGWLAGLWLQVNARSGLPTPV